MTRDERLETALARLSAALVELEAAIRRSRDATQAEAPGLAFELEQARARAARLEAATTEASRVLETTIATLAELVGRDTDLPRT